MKKLIFMITLLMGTMFLGTSVQAAGVATANGVVITNPTTTAPTAVAKKTGFFTKVGNFLAKTYATALGHVKAGDDKMLIGILLCFFLGGFGAHRVYLGSGGIMILWYILTGFGLFGILPLVELIRMIISGTGFLEGNQNVFAAFGGGGK